MTEKETIRYSDRRKLKRNHKIIVDYYKSIFCSDVVCNRCKIASTLKNLEIHHLTYENESYSYGELVCRPCHMGIEMGTLPSFEQRRNIAPQTVFVFQKFLSGLTILSKLKDGRIVQRGRLRLRANEEVKPYILLGIFK